MPATVSTTAPSAIHKTMDTKELRDVVTNNYSTKKFRVEYGDFFLNHLLHGVVALFELGATQEQIEAFMEYYAQHKLEPLALDHEDPYEAVSVAANLSSDAAIPSAERLQELLGKRRDFDALLAFYGHEVVLLGAEAAIQKHLPGLVAGLAGALLHGLIHVGYAYHMGGDRLIAEGLAYFHFSYVLFEDPTTRDSVSSQEKKPFTREEALRVAHAVKNHEFILSEMQAQFESKALKELAMEIGEIQTKLNALSAHPGRGSAAAFQAISSTLDAYDFSSMNGAFAIDFSLWLYAMIEHNDFVIMHAVSAAWSLKQLEHLLDHDNRVRAWRVWFQVAISAFILKDVNDLSVHDVCDDRSTATPPDAWDTIISNTLALKAFPDEHVYKLVQIAHAHATCDAEDASSFLSRDEREFLARKAASKVISLEFEIN